MTRFGTDFDLAVLRPVGLENDRYGLRPDGWAIRASPRYTFVAAIYICAGWTLRRLGDSAGWIRHLWRDFVFGEPEDPGVWIAYGTWCATERCAAAGAHTSNQAGSEWNRAGRCACPDLGTGTQKHGL